MNKTIEQILLPKPELRPRIYAYRAWMRLGSGEFLRAKGATYDSPGQRPGYRIQPLRPSGSRPKQRNWRVLRGNQGMECLPFPNRTSRPSANTSLVSVSITDTRRFRRNTANSSKGIVSLMARDMYGIDPQNHRHWVALSGLEWLNAITPRALPWAGINRPVGAGISRRVGAGLIESNLEEQTDA